MAITTQIPSLPTPPSSTDKADFRVRADGFLGALPTLSDAINQFGIQANYLKDEVNNARDTTLTYKNDAENTKNFTYGYKVEAVNAANDIQNYVIPSETTYSTNEIDIQLSEITRVQVSYQITLSYLQNSIVALNETRYKKSDIDEKIGGIYEEINNNANETARVQVAQQIILSYLQQN